MIFNYKLRIAGNVKVIKISVDYTVSKLYFCICRGFFFGTTQEIVEAKVLFRVLRDSTIISFHRSLQTTVQAERRFVVKRSTSSV